MTELYVYEKELLTIVNNVQKWKQYLSSDHFYNKDRSKELEVVAPTIFFNSLSTILDV